MPVISEAQLANIRNVIASTQNRAATAKARAEKKAGEIKDGAEIVGAAAFMGLLRGYAESKGIAFTVPYTNIDYELLAGLGLVGAGMFFVGEKYDDDCLMLGYGCLAHYAGQVSRKFAKSEPLVAGNMFPSYTAPYQMSGGSVSGAQGLEAVLAGVI
jgi:hypothetical protein